MYDQHWIQRRWLRWGLYFSFWTFLGLCNATQSYFMRASIGVPLDWWRAILIGVSDWYLWALLTPIVFRLAREFPFEPGIWPRSLIAHALVYLTATTLIIELLVPVFWLAGCEPLIHKTFGEVFHFLFASMLIFYLWVYLAILCVSIALEYHRKYREREVRAAQLEAQLAQAQLQMLKMQLHPHFLFNTLNAISALMHKNVDVADRMIARLGDLLRLTLENAGTQEVTLRQELDFIQPYLEIEQARFGTRLAVQLDIDPAVMDARVPNLILQPLVENAIRHGVAPRADAGRIAIGAYRENGTLHLQVRDNGPGLGSGGNATVKEGVGLTNTRARLRQLYGAAHQFDIGNAPGGGWLAQLAIPLRLRGARAGQGQTDADGPHSDPDCG